MLVPREVLVTMEDCIFCNIGSGNTPADKLYDDGVVFAIRDKYPKAPVHLLVIPHGHIGPLASADSQALETAAHCLSVAPQLARAAGVDSRGYRLVVNQGPDSGQEVPHFHLHILGGRRLGPMV